MIVDVVGITVN